MLVKATNKYKELNLKDNELGRIPKEGEQWELTEERYKVKTETAVKKTRKKTKQNDIQR